MRSFGGTFRVLIGNDSLSSPDGWETCDESVIVENEDVKNFTCTDSSDSVARYVRIVRLQNPFNDTFICLCQVRIGAGRRICNEIV